MMKRKCFLLLIFSAVCVAIPASGDEINHGSNSVRTSVASTGETALPAALKTLFGNRSIQETDEFVKLKIPMIIHHGDILDISIVTTAPSSKQIRQVYVIADTNREPLAAKFTFAPESSPTFVRIRIGLERTSDVRGIVELSDGTLWMARRTVKISRARYSS
jgi:sulfur-oxidizing protein SoxY